MRVARLLLFVSALLALDVTVAGAQAKPASTQDIQNPSASPGLVARLDAHHGAETSGDIVGSTDTAWE